METGSYVTASATTQFPESLVTETLRGARGIQDQRGRSRRDEAGRDIIRWCFADPRLAKAFSEQFQK